MLRNADVPVGTEIQSGDVIIRKTYREEPRPVKTATSAVSRWKSTVSRWKSAVSRWKSAVSRWKSAVSRWESAVSRWESAVSRWKSAVSSVLISCAYGTQRHDKLLYQTVYGKVR
jgi:hypothetical protein